MADSNKTSGTVGDVNWSSITSASTDQFQFTVDDKIIHINKDYEITEKKINKGRRKVLCNGCGNAYFLDTGVDGQFCKLDCKYARCVLEEETEDEK